MLQIYLLTRRGTIRVKARGDKEKITERENRRRKSMYTQIFLSNE